jgi:hypothetical protein
MPKLTVKAETHTPHYDQASSKQATNITLKSSRRGFLQLGFVASTSLVLASNLVQATDRIKPITKVEEVPKFQFLDDASAAFFTALFPVVLAKKSLDKTLSNSLLLALDDLIYHFNAFNQKQMQQLFDVMAFAPLRLVAGAPWVSWQDASAEEIQHFLENWRDSRFELKRMGYLSICKVINLCWYARKDVFADMGYPGPPIKIPTPIST